MNDHSLARTTVARRDLLLQLEKNIVEQIVSIDTTVKKITRDLRRLISAASSRAACCCSAAAQQSLRAAIVGRTYGVESVRNEKNSIKGGEANQSPQSVREE